MAEKKFDRSKFKTTQATTLKQADKEVDAVVRNRNANADYLKLDDGVNVFRIYPYHPDGGGEAFAEARAMHWLTVDSPKRDKDNNVIKDAKGNFEMERGRKPIFNSKVHGGTEKDLIEEYIAATIRLSKDRFPGNEKKQKEFLDPIYGGFKSKYDGIMAKQDWVMYVDKITFSKDGKINKEFGRLPIGRAIKQRLNELSAIEGGSEPLGTDPFTDLEDGRAIYVTKNPKAEKPQDYYLTELDNSFDKVTKKVKLYPLTDEDLEKFLKYPSLHSLFVGVYKKRDFDLALNGLQIFDTEHGYGIFEQPAFIETCEEISNYYTAGGVAETEEEEEEESTADKFDDMNRSELKAFLKEKGTGFVTKTSTTDDQLRDKCREWELANTKPEEVEEEEEEEEEEEAPEPEPVKVAEKKGKKEEKNDLPWKANGEETDEFKKQKSEKKAEVAEVPPSDTKDRVAAIRAKVAAGKK